MHGYGHGYGYGHCRHAGMHGDEHPLHRHGPFLSHHYANKKEMLDELTAQRDALKEELERVEKLIQELG